MRGIGLPGASCRKPLIFCAVEIGRQCDNVSGGYSYYAHRTQTLGVPRHVRSNVYPPANEPGCDGKYRVEMSP